MSEIEADPRFAKAIACAEALDYAGSLFLWRSLAEDGFKYAYSRVALLYETGGHGVECNYDEALKWYRRSYFEAKDLNGRIGLGRMYFLGRGLKQDFEVAFRYLSEAAVGNQVASVYFMLGQTYLDGKGVEPNVLKARSLFVRAAAKGNLPALAMVGVADRRLGKCLRGTCLQYRTAFRVSFVALRDLEDERLTTV